MQQPVSKPWFQAKRLGYGASPASWQGWGATALLVLLGLLDAAALEGPVRWLVRAVLITAFVALGYLKGPGQWSWRS